MRKTKVVIYLSHNESPAKLVSELIVCVESDVVRKSVAESRVKCRTKRCASSKTVSSRADFVWRFFTRKVI